MNANTTEGVTPIEKGYAPINGLNLYYEVYGSGKPLVLIHGGGSTIESNFGRLIPVLSKTRKLVAVEMQAHGHTPDRTTALSFEQDAADVSALLDYLHIEKAAVLGFSNGGTTALQLAIRHAEKVEHLILCSALAKRAGMPNWFWDFMNQANLENMPEQLKQAYLKIANDEVGLQTMHDRDVKRMLDFMDIPDELIAAVKAKTLLVSGDKDVVLPEHTLALYRLLSNSALAILPGGHGDYLGEITTITAGEDQVQLFVAMVEKFLDQ